MRTIAAIFTALFLAGTAGAQTYPTRPVKVVVPWPPGQATDIAARVIANKLQEVLGQPFVVENRPGAGGSIGTDVAAKSAADGYTLLAASSGPVSIMPSLQKIPYEPLRDLTPIGLITRNAYALVTGPGFPAANAREFIAELKAHPDKYTFATSGTGATAHLITELFNSMAQVQARHVPYKGSAPALTDVMNGQVSYAIETVASLVGHVRAGRLKTFGVTTQRRSGAMPEVPTLAEVANLPDFDAAAWIGYAAPAGTPREIIQRLSGEMQKMIQTPEMKERLINLGLDPVSMSADEMPGFLRKEQERYASIIRSANIKVDPQ